jgi:hypothetical protein
MIQYAHKICFPLDITWKLNMQLSEDRKTLLKVTQHDLANGTFSIPHSVTHIGNLAFWCCIKLTQVSIPHSVTHIGDSAFYGCIGLTQISIPYSVTNIGISAFSGCTGFTQVNIPHSVTHIGKNAFMSCRSLTQVTIPNSVIEIGALAFAHCTNLSVMIIDAPNEQAYRRISNLLPQELQNRIMDFGLYPEINQAKQQALMLIKTIAMSFFPRKLPEELTSIIWQFEGRFHDVFNQVPLPVKASELDKYKQALQQVVKQFSLEQELLQQKFVADKLQQYVQRTKTTIEEAGKRNKGFFDSPENQAKLTESKARIAVTEKLIAWLCGDKNMSFNENEKTLLSNPESIVASILEKNGIPVEELPKAPSSGRSLNK